MCLECVGEVWDDRVKLSEQSNRARSKLMKDEIGVKVHSTAYKQIIGSIRYFNSNEPRLDVSCRFNQ